MTIQQPANALQTDGVQDIPTAAEGFVFNHTMLRVKDPKVSLAFYTGILGMSLVDYRSFPESQFDLYFLVKLSDEERARLPKGADLKAFVSRSRAVLELTHNYGTEKQEGFAYHNGNSDPRGFGHICFSVPNLQQAVAWFDKNGVEFQKRPEEGSMSDIAFVKDPDGYWVEIVEQT